MNRKIITTCFIFFPSLSSAVSLSRCETKGQRKRIGNAPVDGQQNQRRDEITTLILTFFLLVFLAVVALVVGRRWPVLLLV